MKVNREDRSEERVSSTQDCCEKTLTCKDVSCGGTLVKRPDVDTNHVLTFAKYLENECCTPGLLCGDKDTEETCKVISYVPKSSLPTERFLESKFNEECCEPLTCSLLATREPGLCERPRKYKGQENKEQKDNTQVCNFNMTISLSLAYTLCTK